MIVSSGNQAQRAIALGAFAKLPVLSPGPLLSSNVSPMAMGAPRGWPI
jgi:hypothetical protein